MYQARIDHRLIVANTQNGKTSLGIALAKQDQREGREVIIYTSQKRDPWPKGCHKFYDRDSFLAVMRHPKTKNCAVYVDECIATLDHHDDELNETATSGRHDGHRYSYMAHSIMDIPPRIRRNCTDFYLGLLSTADQRILAKEFAGMDFFIGMALMPGDFINVDPYRKKRKFNIFT